MALITLDGGRIGVAAQALGIAQSAIDHCKKYVTEHMQGELRISQYQFTQFELADMQARVDAARLLVYRAAQAKQDHEPFSHLAAMGKLYAAETIYYISILWDVGVITLFYHRYKSLRWWKVLN